MNRKCVSEQSVAGFPMSIVVLLTASVLFSSCMSHKALTDTPSTGRVCNEEIVATVIVVKGDGTEIQKHFTADQIAQWQEEMAGQVAGWPKHGYVSDRQSRFSQFNHIVNFCGASVHAFYRQYDRMPASVDELYESGWFWFDPIPTEYAPGLQIVDRSLAAPDEDLNTVSFRFLSSGYQLYFYDLYNPGKVPEEFIKVDFSKLDFIALAEDQAAELPEGSILTDSNPMNIRIDYLSSICDSLVTSYWKFHADFPANTEQLLDGKWVPRQDILQSLEMIPTEEEGWFYFGVSPDKGIAYIEYTYVESVPVVQQKLYTDDQAPDESGEGWRQIGRYICNQNGVTRDETIPLVDSSLPHWGFPVGD